MSDAEKFALKQAIANSELEAKALSDENRELLINAIKHNTKLDELINSLNLVNGHTNGQSS